MTKTKQGWQRRNRLPIYDKYVNSLQRLRVGYGFYTPEYWEHSYIQHLARRCKIRIRSRIVYKDNKKYLAVIRIRKQRKR